jgi:hypothetical protein
MAHTADTYISCALNQPRPPDTPRVAPIAVALALFNPLLERGADADNGGDDDETDGNDDDNDDDDDDDDADKADAVC